MPEPHQPFAVLQPRHPGWPPGPLPQFADWYDLLGRVAFPIHGRTPKRRYFGARSPRKCCLCGVGAPVASFATLSHALPAALGNRHLFSMEECDSCNARYSGWEGELASLLAPQRVLGATRARRQRPKISVRGMSSIEAVSSNEIRIFQDSRDDSIRLDMGSESGSLTMTCPPHRPMGAVLALLRSLWLVLDSNQRSLAPQLLQAITGSAPPSTQLFRFTSPGMRLPNAVLAGWTKKGPGTIAGATFVLQFAFVDTVLTWLWGDEEGTRAPSLLPPVLGLPDSIRSGQYLRLGPDHRVEDSTVTYHFSFDTKPVAPPTVAAGSRLPADDRQTRVPALLETVSGERKLVLTSNLGIEPADSGPQRIHVEGGEWPGSFVFAVGPDLESGSIELRWFPHSMTPRAATRAAEFLEALRVSRSLSLSLAGTGALVFRATLDSLELPTVPELPLLRDLALVNEAFGVDIRIPKRVTQEFLNDVSYVASIVMTGSANHRKGTASLSLPVENASALEKELQLAVMRETHPRLTIDYKQVTATIEGIELELGSCTRNLAVTSIRATPVDAATALVEVDFSGMADHFPRWSPK